MEKRRNKTISIKYYAKIETPSLKQTPTKVSLIFFRLLGTFVATIFINDIAQYMANDDHLLVILDVLLNVKKNTGRVSMNLQVCKRTVDTIYVWEIFPP